MSIETDIVDVLEADAAVIGLLGAPPNTRIYPEILPQDPAYPAVTYFRVDTHRERGLSGPCGYARPRFQFDVWATGYGSKRAVADAIRRALDGFQSAAIGSSSLIDESDEPAGPDIASAGTTLYRVRQDYLIGHTET